MGYGSVTIHAFPPLSHRTLILDVAGACVLLAKKVVRVIDRDEGRQMVAGSPDPAQHHRGLQSSAGTCMVLAFNLRHVLNVCAFSCDIERCPS